MRCEHLINRRRCKREVTGRKYCWQHSKKVIKNNSSVGGGKNVKTSVKTVVNSNRFAYPKEGSWEIYGKSYCPYTLGAIQHLNDSSLSCRVVFYDIGKFNMNTSELRQKLIDKGYKVGSHSTVPMIFNDKNKFIGGFTQLKRN